MHFYEELRSQNFAFMLKQTELRVNHLTKYTKNFYFQEVQNFIC